MERKRPQHLKLVKEKKSDAPFVALVVALGAGLVIVGVALFKEPKREVVAAARPLMPVLPSLPSAPPPGATDGYVGGPRKVSSCQTVWDEPSGLRAFVVAEGRSYLVAAPDRFFCWSTVSVQEAMFSGDLYLCSLDDRGRGSCGPMVDSR